MMIVNNKGFLLFTVCVYIVVLCLFIHVSVHILYKGFIEMQECGVKSQVIADKYIAFDLFIRDLWGAPKNSNLWLHITDNALMWVKNDAIGEAIGWIISNTKIKRIQGMYDKKTLCWRNKTESLVCNKIPSARFTATQRDDLMQTVTLEIAGETELMHTTWSFYGR